MKSLNKEERFIKLSECSTSKEYYDLYELIFEEEVPLIIERDPTATIDKIIDAVISNKKIQADDLPENVDI